MLTLADKAKPAYLAGSVLAALVFAPGGARAAARSDIEDCILDQAWIDGPAYDRAVPAG